jgi:hypothetical protein
VRRAVKIKAYFILIAWMTIFIHNVIPHNHIEDNFTCCSNIVHKSVGNNNDQITTARLLSQPEEQTVCHASGLLFHNLSQENLATCLPQQINLTPLRIADRIIPFEDQSYFSDHYRGSTPFRAPPEIL